MKKILLAGVLGIGLFSACNDNYLEKYPLTSLTEQNAFWTIATIKLTCIRVTNYLPIQQFKLILRRTA